MRRWRGRNELLDAPCPVQQPPYCSRSSGSRAATGGPTCGSVEGEGGQIGSSRAFESRRGRGRTTSRRRTLRSSSLRMVSDSNASGSCATWAPAPKVKSVEHLDGGWWGMGRTLGELVFVLAETLLPSKGTAHGCGQRSIVRPIRRTRRSEILISSRSRDGSSSVKSAPCGTLLTLEALERDALSGRGVNDGR